MSAAILREAAALMRERAEAAALATGDDPWHFDGIGWSDPHGMTYTVRNTATAHVAEAITEEQAEHIASWHPAVALAVADLLDGWADDIERYGGRHGSDDRALAVARAYLGEPS